MTRAGVVLGRDSYGGAVELALNDRLRHLYVLGQTGTGKSTLLRNLVLQDLYLGHGVTLIDFHGDLVADVLASYPSWRANDLCLLDVTDRSRAFRFNPLALGRVDAQRDVAVTMIVAAFKSIWRDSWGPRLEYILTQSLATLLCSEKTTLLALPRLLTDDPYRYWLLKRVTDPVLLTFWYREFGAWDRRYRQEAVAPILNKVGQLFTSPRLRYILGQLPRGLDPNFLIRSERVLLVNLAKGQFGETNASLLGALIVAALFRAALGQGNRRPDQRVPHHLVIDEFQSCTTTTFASILAESRKYGLSLTLANQYLEQVDPAVSAAVFGNVGSMVALRVGETDAHRIAAVLGKFPASQYTALANHSAIARVMQDGHPAGPFHMDLLPPHEAAIDRSTTLARASRQRFTTPVADIEEKLGRWYRPAA